MTRLPPKPERPELDAPIESAHDRLHRLYGRTISDPKLAAIRAEIQRGMAALERALAMLDESSKA